MVSTQAGTESPVRRRNNVKISGHGTQPMVFAHGFGCDQNMWRFVAPAFEPSHKIVLYDQVGAGQSDLSAYSRSKYASLDGYVADLLEILAAEELSDIVFVGHS
ncbi:MAG TPA: alpha/beta hydrolase, partial [Gemmatimonadales bacterium]